MQVVVQKSISMELCSEQKEVMQRSRAAVQAADVLPSEARTASFVALCQRQFGTRATSLFQKEFDAASRYHLSPTEVHDDGSRLVTVTEVQSGKTRQLTLAPAASRWACSCGTERSFRIPCRHLIHYIRSVQGHTFDTFAAYFHDRWRINTELPRNTMLKTRLPASDLEKLLKQGLDGVEPGDGDDDAGAGADADVEQDQDQGPASGDDDAGAAAGMSQVLMDNTSSMRRAHPVCRTPVATAQDHARSKCATAGAA